jgi:hypothetical protein
MTQHEINREFGGKNELSWKQLICSCGWKGKKHYAYNDYQFSNLRAEENEHITKSPNPL